MNEFENKKMTDIPEILMPKIKIRDLNPLVNGKRFKTHIQFVIFIFYLNLYIATVMVVFYFQ